MSLCRKPSMAELRQTHFDLIGAGKVNYGGLASTIL